MISAERQPRQLSSNGTALHRKCFVLDSCLYHNGGTLDGGVPRGRAQILWYKSMLVNVEFHLGVQWLMANVEAKKLTGLTATCSDPFVSVTWSDTFVRCMYNFPKGYAIIILEHYGVDQSIF